MCVTDSDAPIHHMLHLVASAYSLSTRSGLAFAALVDLWHGSGHQPSVTSKFSRGVVETTQAQMFIYNARLAARNHM